MRPVRGPGIALLALLAACAPSPPALDAGPDAGVDPCGALFGVPGPQTGLDDLRCRPVCGCGDGAFTPRAWDEAALAALRATVAIDPPQPLAADPYAAPAPAPDPEGTVCAVQFEGPAAYRLRTFTGAAEAASAGATVTHAGACGQCSTLADLAVYAGTPDLTAPVRACGLSNVGDFAGLSACLEALGFSAPCAQIWAFNTEHTRAACGATCLRWLDRPYHLPDGSLNPCLVCDEVQSGAVFKAVAGRTRRNSGLANAMCRPCSEVVRLDHAYPGL